MFSNCSRESGIHLTGDSKTDADIIAFMKARQNLLQNKGMLIAFTQNRGLIFDSCFYPLSQ